MLFSITTDYFCAEQISKNQRHGIRKIFLCLSIFVNLAILGFFKYFNFFTGNTFPFHMILPLGISFYTFEAISYTVDVYRGLVKPAKTYADYLLFVIYFPHLIAGPIMRAKNFLPQIILPRVVTQDNFYGGCSLFFWGLFEKIFVADNLAKIVNPVFAAPAPYEGVPVWMALYAFTFQILCDFDGYSNMARGLGLCMGFDIAVNFKWPYFASNPREFWHRWHITLSTWLRDYLYIPLGGNKKGDSTMYAALFITMLLGGLWHGAAWTFVLWGAYHGLILMIHRFMTHKNGEGNKNFLKIILFFHCVVLGWVFFRAQSVGQAAEMLKGMVFHCTLSSKDMFQGLKLAGLIAPFLLVQVWQYKNNDLMVIYKQHWLLKNFIYAFMTYLLLGWGVMNAQEFLYFQF